MGFISNLVKYTLLGTNLLIFVSIQLVLFLRVKQQLSLAVSFTSLHKENTVIAAADMTRCKCHDDHQTFSASLLYIVSYLSCSVWLFSAAVSGSWWTVPRSLISSTRSRMCVVRIDLNY